MKHFIYSDPNFGVFSVYVFKHFLVSSNLWTGFIFLPESYHSIVCVLDKFKFSALGVFPEVTVDFIKENYTSLKRFKPWVTIGRPNPSIDILSFYNHHNKKYHITIIGNNTKWPRLPTMYERGIVLDTKKSHKHIMYYIIKKYIKHSIFNSFAYHLIVNVIAFFGGKYGRA